MVTCFTNTAFNANSDILITADFMETHAVVIAIPTIGLAVIVACFANLEYAIANVVGQCNGLSQMIYVAAGSRRPARLKADEMVRATVESVSL